MLQGRTPFKLRPLRWLFIAVASSLWPAASRAQAADPAAPVPGEAPAGLAEVQVVGDKPAPPRSASDVTRGRTVLSAAPHRTAHDLLRVCPGAYITQHGGEGKAYQIFYRSFDAVHGQDLEIWAGGAPVNDVSNIHGQGYADLHFLMPEVIKEVRCSPGNYDPRQGDFAVAGSIHFALGYDRPGITAKAAAGSFDTQRYFLAYRPREAGAGTFGAVEIYATDGFGPSRAARRASAVAQVQYDVADVAVRVMASGYAGSFDSPGVLRLRDIETRVVDRWATYDPRQGGSSGRMQLVVDASQVKDGARWSIAPYLVLRSMRLRSNFTGFLADSTNGDSVQQHNDASTAGATGYYRFNLPLLSKRDVVEAGFFVRTDWIGQSQRRLSSVDDHVTADEVDARVRATDVAGYFDAAVRPLPSLLVRAGLRADGLSYQAEDGGAGAGGQARSSQGAHLGTKANVELTVISGLALLASYGEGFRSPQARSLAEGQTTPFTEVTSYEAGIRFREGSTLQASAAAFRTTLSNDLVFDHATGRNETVPATARTGVAAEFVSLPAEWWTSSMAITYTRAEFRATARGYDEGDLLPYVPQLVVRSDLAFTPQLGTLYGMRTRLHAGAALTSLHRRPLPFSEMGHDVFLIDARLAVRIGEVQAGIDVFNLLDAGWYDGEFSYASNFSPGGPAGLVPLRHVTVGAPRTFLFSLSMTI